MNTELYQSVKALILNNIESEAIDRARVRQIIVGISRDGQSIKLWQQEEWDDYNEYDDDAAVGEISNLEWLAQLDRISFGQGSERLTDVLASSHLPRMGVGLGNPEWQDLYRRLLTVRIQELVAVLKKLAGEQALGEFKNLVGLMGMRITNSGYADLVSIYDPRGTEPMGGSERRLPGNSMISWIPV